MLFSWPPLDCPLSLRAAYFRLDNEMLLFMSGNFEYFYTRLFVSSVSDFIVSLSIHSDLYRFWKVTFLLIEPKPTTKTNFHILPGQNIQKSKFFRASWTDGNAGRTIRVYSATFWLALDRYHYDTHLWTDFMKHYADRQAWQFRGSLVYRPSSTLFGLWRVLKKIKLDSPKLFDPSIFQVSIILVSNFHVFQRLPTEPRSF